jgi:hypothetical protein
MPASAMPAAMIHAKAMWVNTLSATKLASSSVGPFAAKERGES